MHAVTLFCRAALNSGYCILPKPVLQCIGADSRHTCMKSKSSQESLQRYGACCDPVLQSSTEQWGLHSALNRAAVHLCCLTAHLYGEQVSIDVIAVTQTCCQPVLQSNTDQGGNAFCLDQCCTAFLLPHCTPVWRANLHRCDCSDTSLL